MLEQDRAYLSRFRRGGGWALDKLQYTGKVEDRKCTFCEAENQTVDHLVWECPEFAEQRRTASHALGKRGHLVLTPAIKIGQFPPLHGGRRRSFWGCHRAEPWVTLPEDAEDLIGMSAKHDPQGRNAAEITTILDTVAPVTTARDHLTRLHNSGTTADLPGPRWISQEAPTAPNVYSGRSLYNSTNQS